MKSITPRLFPLFLWRLLPAAAFMGVRLHRLDDAHCITRLALAWRNKNPFRSVYFAAQLSAAEMASGLPAFQAVKESGGKVSMLVTGLEARFHQKATGKVLFTFSEVKEIRERIDQASLSVEPVHYEAVIRATREEDGGLLSEFSVQWRFRSRINTLRSAP